MSDHGAQLRSNECWSIHCEGGKPENLKKNPRRNGENQQQTQLTYDTESGNQTWVTVVRGEQYKMSDCVYTLEVEEHLGRNQLCLSFIPLKLPSCSTTPIVFISQYM
jgi:hypothetical protein